MPRLSQGFLVLGYPDASRNRSQQPFDRDTSPAAEHASLAHEESAGTAGRPPCSSSCEPCDCSSWSSSDGHGRTTSTAAPTGNRDRRGIVDNRDAKPGHLGLDFRPETRNHHRVGSSGSRPPCGGRESAKNAPSSAFLFLARDSLPKPEIPRTRARRGCGSMPGQESAAKSQKTALPDNHSHRLLTAGIQRSGRA